MRISMIFDKNARRVKCMSNRQKGGNIFRRKVKNHCSDEGAQYNEFKQLEEPKILVPTNTYYVYDLRS